MCLEEEEKQEEPEEDEEEEEEKNKTENKTKQFFVYLLESSRGATYVGATIDVARRLRQHNKEITGGAVATGTRVLRGETWQICCYVANFPTWQAALQFEWRWKQISRKGIKGMSQKEPLARRALALHTLLALEKPTTKSVPYSQWPVAPEIIFAAPGAKFSQLYDEIQTQTQRKYQNNI